MPITRATERLLVLPALLIIKEHGECSTTDLIKELFNLFGVEGIDAEWNPSRGDSKFSQLVRNIIAHKNGKLMPNVNYSKNKMSLSVEGLIFLKNHSDIFDEISAILEDTSFTYYEKLEFLDIAVQPLFTRGSRRISPQQQQLISNKVLSFDERVSEGNELTRNVKVRDRSKKLRDAAVHFFTHDGVIQCEICGFNYGSNYGELGRGYIEIHHKNPVWMYENDDIDRKISDALPNLCPVCASCHRMLHRRKTTTYDEVVNAWRSQHP